MSNLDIEKELTELAQHWPGQSVAKEVVRQLTEQQALPKRLASDAGRTSKRQVLPWLGVVAASIALIFVWQLSYPQTLQAALQRSLAQRGQLACCGSSSSGSIGADNWENPLSQRPRAPHGAEWASHRG